MTRRQIEREIESHYQAIADLRRDLDRLPKPKPRRKG